MPTRWRTDGLALGVAEELADGDVEAVGSGSGTVPKTGSHAVRSSVTAVVTAAVAASNAVGSMVTVRAAPAEPDPDDPAPVDPDPADEDPGFAPEPDELLALDGCCAAYSDALASATVVSASSTASWSGPFFSAASTSPASTSSPTATETLFTVPSTANEASDVLVRVIVPVAV